MKVIAKVTFNQAFGYVFDEDIVLKYIELEDKSLVGFDKSKTLFSFFAFDPTMDNAFGGREITVNMLDGSQKKIKDFWWNGTNRCIEDYIKKNNLFLILEAANSKKNMMKCFVFFGFEVDRDKFHKLVNEYTDKVYKYRELEKIYRKRQAELTSIKFSDYHKDLFYYRYSIYSRNDLYRLIKFKNLSQNQLRRGVVCAYEEKEEFCGMVYHTTGYEIRFTKEDNKNIKKISYKHFKGKKNGKRK